MARSRVRGWIFHVSIVVAAACGTDPEATTDGGVDGGLPMCSGKSITASGSFDVDIGVARVTGSVTLAGAPLPPDASGALEFTEDTTNVSLTVPLAASYSVAVAPGK